MDATIPLDPALATSAYAIPTGPGARAIPDPAAVDRTARDFEAFFVSSMIESMTTGLKTPKMFGGGSGEQMYRSLLNQEYGKAIAAHGSLGLADSIRRDMLRLQEAANHG
jgi:Rod binding domain-containing protein